MEETHVKQCIQGKIRHIQQHLMYVIILKSSEETDNYTTKPTCNGTCTTQQISTAQKAGEWGPMRTPKTDRKVVDLRN
jgi:hypothetical protein